MWCCCWNHYEKDKTGIIRSSYSIKTTGWG
uniref:Uncharacterized protein n=1 Tax=Anguilla anguilla TaxID=7936 RepID=A0A0E9TEP1_ANGAN